jgi:hypothetical protein
MHALTHQHPHTYTHTNTPTPTPGVRQQGHPDAGTAVALVGKVGEAVVIIGGLLITGPHPLCVHC